eukprot:TRINITY_DN55284_c0_g1_i1.p1 TRINITY_DN55284_c0_g1~~TRINITY_DN55284_c0_g1_i1.p1  ORF type:complete len:169 (-),score=21.90 TRINITY_DN55284_c0_g1_i1:89-574(-)
MAALASRDSSCSSADQRRRPGSFRTLPGKFPRLGSSCSEWSVLLSTLKLRCAPFFGLSSGDRPTLVGARTIFLDGLLAAHSKARCLCRPMNKAMLQTAMLARIAFVAWTSLVVGKLVKTLRSLSVIECSRDGCYFSDASSFSSLSVDSGSSGTLDCSPAAF